MCDPIWPPLWWSATPPKFPGKSNLMQKRLRFTIRKEIEKSKVLYDGPNRPRYSREEMKALTISASIKLPLNWLDPLPRRGQAPAWHEWWREMADRCCRSDLAG